jgi:cytoskeletal protein CcmA (bactofilin family)
MPDAGPEIALREGMAFEGLLVLPRTARIDGRVRGEVIAGETLWVGPTGRVEADLHADSLVVEGHVAGRLQARSAIALGPGAVVQGDVTAPRLQVADGALLNGVCRCGEQSGR